ncbi:MAG: hypothetical protein ABR581_10505 [Thermoleophilaceae bacterium]
MRRAAAALLVMAVSVGGCGGDPKEETRQAVRDFVKATNERDAKRYCNDLVTKAYVEGVTGAKGSAARSVCRKQLGLQRVPKVRIVEIRKTVVHDDRAKVTTLLQAGGQSRPQVLSLRKQDGNWRIADAGGD